MLRALAVGVSLDVQPLDARALLAAVDSEKPPRSSPIASTSPVAARRIVSGSIMWWPRR